MFLHYEVFVAKDNGVILEERIWLCGPSIFDVVMLHPTKSKFDYELCNEIIIGKQPESVKNSEGTMIHGGGRPHTIRQEIYYID